MERFWNPQNTARLEELVDKGLSAHAISMLIGCSRNAVIGRMWRLGLRSTAVPDYRRNHPKRLPSVPHRKAVPAVERASPPRQQEEARAGTPHADDGPRLPSPTGAADALIALEPADCRWPLGDPQEKSFSFCRAPRSAGSPYCQEHVRKAYNGRHAS